MPSSSLMGIDVCPARKREPHALHSDLAPLGPLALEGVSISLHAHQSHCHLPPVQWRRCCAMSSSDASPCWHVGHG